MQKSSSVKSKKKFTSKNDGHHLNEVHSAQKMIVKLLESRQSRMAGASNSNTRTGRRIPEWVDVKDGLMIYKFNVFNNDKEHVDHAKLKSILTAIEKDANETLSKDYGTTCTFNLYSDSEMKNPDLFKGDRMAIFVGKYKNGAFHYINTPEPTNTYSFPCGGGKLSAYGITIPSPNNFDYVPYSVISSDSVPDFFGLPNNIYAVSPTTVPVDTFHQMISCMISHEVKEILGNDTTLNWVLFDHYSPTVANWKWAEFKEDRCTNGKVGKDGYVELPTFLKKFPSGGLFFAVREVGDVVSAGFAGLLNSYKVNGWLIQNHPLQNFWRPYNHDPDVKYDHLGHVQYPLEPYGGLHQLIFFISFDTAKTMLIEVQNKGPVTYEMRGAHKDNNFPPNYVTVKKLSMIDPGANVLALIESLENYGPAGPDRT